VENGFFHNYDIAAAASSLNTAIGGLIVASVLKYADSVLKGYATAVSVVLTGTASSILFGTELSVFYGMGIVNVVVAVLLFNSSGLDDVFC
jgi:UDP-sugar transporter A1/2/3